MGAALVVASRPGTVGAAAQVIPPPSRVTIASAAAVKLRRNLMVIKVLVGRIGRIGREGRSRSEQAG